MILKSQLPAFFMIFEAFHIFYNIFKLKYIYIVHIYDSIYNIVSRESYSIQRTVTLHPERCEPVEQSHKNLLSRKGTFPDPTTLPGVLRHGHYDYQLSLIVTFPESRDKFLLMRSLAPGNLSITLPCFLMVRRLSAKFVPIS